MSSNNTIRFTVNGQEVAESASPPTTTLLNYLRYDLEMTGTKEGCAEGDCGACTVVVIDHDAEGGPAFRAVNSCLVLLPMVQGKDVITVEGLRDADGSYHPVQHSLVKYLGSQCGYCTPGIIMSMFEACYREDLDEKWKVDDQMCGNLCRCTGYRPIKDATLEIAGSCPEDRFVKAKAASEKRSMDLSYEARDQKYFTPVSFDGLWDVLDANPDALFVVGGTDLSLRITKQFEELPLLVSLEGIDALRSMTRTDEGWTLGANAVLSDIEAATKDDLPPLERMLRFFGARQIKNRGTVGGNLCNASPIGDMAPALIALSAEAILRSRSGERRMSLEDFFVDYRKTALSPNEILAGVFVPHIAPNSRASSYKVSKRQELDISAVSAGMTVVLDDAGVVTEARLAYGGMAATPKRASKTEAALVGAVWSEESVEAAAAHIDEDFTPMNDHRGSAWYRGTVAKNLLRGFYHETLADPAPRLPYRPTGTVNLETQP